MANTWSKELQESSKEMLYNGQCMNPCRIKNCREDDRFGEVDVINGIVSCKWTVVTDSGREEEYLSVEDLINAGWVVD